MCWTSQKEEQGDSASSEEEAGSDLEAEDDSDLEDDEGESLPLHTILSPCCYSIFPSEKYPASSFLLHMRIPGMICKYPVGVA